MRTYQWTVIIQHGTLIRFRSIKTVSAENIIVAEADIEGFQYMLDSIFLKDSEEIIGTILIRKHD